MNDKLPNFFYKVFPFEDAYLKFVMGVAYTMLYGRGVKIQIKANSDIYIHINCWDNSQMSVHFTETDYRLIISFPRDVIPELLKPLWLLGFETTEHELLKEYPVTAHQKMEWKKLRQEILNG